MGEAQASKNESVTDKELDWIILRKELDEIRAKDYDPKAYKNNPYVIGGLAFTTVSFLYGMLNMNNPVKSTIGAYLRISSQAITGIMLGYWLLDDLKNKKKVKVSMEYAD